MLDKIVEAKRAEIERDLSGMDIAAARAKINSLPPARDFKAALTKPGLSLIAEIKPVSPSRGVLAEHVDPAAYAAAYEMAGADAISVLTDKEFFGGSVDSLLKAREACALPILRKDFILDERQILQARLAGADAVLLIAAILNDAELTRLFETARNAGLQVLAEAHDEAEVRRLVNSGFGIIGINNRNLADFTVDLAVTERLAPLAPDAVLVSESGIKNCNDARRAAQAGADAILAGEVLMTADDIAEAIKDIKGALVS